ICYRFILDKQENKEESDTITDDVKYDIKNPVISKQRGRLLGRAKSSTEIEDQHPKKKQHLQASEITKRHEVQEKDTRKT
ncbi:28337_t:CDS:1, partial [Dentiscutata erythropus]